MRFFQASVGATIEEDETVYLKAETWYKARDIGRRLWPLEGMEERWRTMIPLEEPPSPEGFPFVFEIDRETNDVRIADGYDFDRVAPRKRSMKSQANGKKASR